MGFGNGLTKPFRKRNVKDLSDKQLDKIKESNIGPEGKLNFSPKYRHRKSDDDYSQGHLVPRSELIDLFLAGKTQGVQEENRGGKQHGVLRRKIRGVVDMSNKGILAFGGYVGIIS